MWVVVHRLLERPQRVGERGKERHLRAKNRYNLLASSQSQRGTKGLTVTGKYYTHLVSEQRRYFETYFAVTLPSTNQQLDPWMRIRVDSLSGKVFLHGSYNWARKEGAFYLKPNRFSMVANGLRYFCLGCDAMY